MIHSTPIHRLTLSRAAERIAFAALFAVIAFTGACQSTATTAPQTEAAKPASKPAPAPARPVRPAPIDIQPSQPSQPKLVAYAQEFPVAAYKIEMLPIPGSADGKIKPFYLSKTELGWEAFDVYIYRLDEEAGKAPKTADAITRPSKPYLPPDRGFGHEGYPAISMSHKNATEFCKWLSAQTGRTYRLPTEAEWEHAARAGAPAEISTGIPTGAKLEDFAWYEVNAAEAPHPVGKKQPNAWGLCDMLGNVAEWVTDKDGLPVTKGGSYRDPADNLTVTTRAPLDRAWNGSDPQIPKSKWWLADAPFIGFRIVCETVIPDGAVAKTANTNPPLTPTQPEKKP